MESVDTLHARVSALEAALSTLKASYHRAIEDGRHPWDTDAKFALERAKKVLDDRPPGSG